MCKDSQTVSVTTNRETLTKNPGEVLTRSLRHLPESFKQVLKDAYKLHV